MKNKNSKIIIETLLPRCHPERSRGISRECENLRQAERFLVTAFLGMTTLVLFVSTVHAAPRYPISELGRCRNIQECRLYCQIPENTPACWSYNRYVLHKNVLGETDTTITFPVAQLGNCASLSECRAYCAKEENHAACREFAVANGLAKPSALTQRITDAAKRELGCNSVDECKQACEIPQNKDICQSFAKKHKLFKKAAPIAREIITQAKEVLGCTDQATCRALCEKPENREKCLVFGEKHKLLKQEIIHRARLSLQSTQPGAPCANDKECIQYCQNHPSECPGFEATQRAISELTSTGSGSPPAHAKLKIGDFIGPSGCRTEGECKAFCEKHPDTCPSFPKKPTSFPTIKVGPGSLNSGKGSFSDLFGKEPSENGVDPTDTPDVDEPETTGATGPTTQ